MTLKSQQNLVPISVGIKLAYELNGGTPYVGVGLSYIWLKEKNHFDLSNTSNSVGAVFKSGIIKKYKRVAFSLFADYHLQRFTVKNCTCRREVTISGLLLGGAIGVTF